MLEEDEEAELRNPFPSPPSHYQTYTTHNLHLLSLLKSRTSTKGEEGQEPDRDQRVVLADEKDVPDWPLTQLEKPRVDWILEEGEYNVFGDTWFVKEKIPSLGELGGQQLYPDDPTIDRRPALLSILRSTLLTYSHLLSSLLLPPPPPSQNPEDRPEWSKHVEWLTVMAQNIMSAANDLRPVQARFNLEAMMKRQLELRREETAALHQKCDHLQQRLLELKNSASNKPNGSSIKSESSLVLNAASNTKPQKADNTTTTFHMPSIDDLLLWAEGSSSS